MKGARGRAPLIAGAVLVLAVNALLLATAAWNRGGRPESVLALTERELALPPVAQEENTDLGLRLVLTHRAPDVVRRASYRRRDEPPSFEYGWFDRAKLGELGFAVALDPADPRAPESYRYARARRAWIVLEFEGEAWQRWLASREGEVRRLREDVERGAAKPGALEDAEALLDLDRTMRSRLFPVDAGKDAGALRRRYPDGRRHAVVEAMVLPTLVTPDEGKPHLAGTVMDLIVPAVHVPAKLRDRLEPLLPRESWSELREREREEVGDAWPSAVPPRYRAEVAFGRRHEPWLVNVTSTGAN